MYSQKNSEDAVSGHISAGCGVLELDGVALGPELYDSVVPCALQGGLSNDSGELSVAGGDFWRCDATDAVDEEVEFFGECGIETLGEGVYTRRVVDAVAVADLGWQGGQVLY